MTAFATPFLFLRNPRGGVENVEAMRDAGFAGIACNVGDHEPAEWEAVVRPRAIALGMWCAPWARTQAPDGSFAYDRAVRLLDIAEQWLSPVIVNAENELKATGDTVTTWLADELRGRDAAVSMEWRPFDDVYWVPLADVPILPQLFPEAGDVDAIGCRDLWHAYGIKCVYPTYGSYGGRTPADYNLAAPYSVYTADDMGLDYAAWSPTSSTWVACVDSPVPEPEPEPEPPDPEPPTNGGSVTATGKGAARSADAAFEHWLDSTASGPNWRDDNPGEWEAVQEYREAPDGTEPPAVKTATGRMLVELVDARRWAEGSHA